MAPDPLPWHSLSYDTDLDGYATNLTEAQLKGAPKYGTGMDWNWGDQTRNRTIEDYYAS
jgi:hypothetical protein